MMVCGHTALTYAACGLADPPSTQQLLEIYVRLVARKRHEERERQQQQRQQQQRGGAAPAKDEPATFLTKKGDRLNSSRRKRRAYRAAHGKKKKKQQKKERRRRRRARRARAGEERIVRRMDCSACARRRLTQMRTGVCGAVWRVGDAGLAPQGQAVCPSPQPGAGDAPRLARCHCDFQHRQKGPPRLRALRTRLLLQRRLTCPAGVHVLCLC